MPAWSKTCVKYAVFLCAENDLYRWLDSAVGSETHGTYIYFYM